MGRIKTQLVKRTTLALYREHRERFTTTFEENKKIVSGLAEFPSKKIRNVVAGYLTRLMRSGKDI